MGRTQTEIVGFGNITRQSLRKVRTDLENAGHNADEIDEILGSQVEETTQLNARQEQMKRDLKALTRAVEASNLKLYRMASGYLDAAIGAVGKGSDAAKNLQRIRRRIRLPVDVAEADTATTDGGPAPGAQA